MKHSLEYIREYLNYLGLIKIKSKDRGRFQHYSSETTLREICAVEKQNIVLYYSHHEPIDEANIEDCPVV